MTANRVRAVADQFIRNVSIAMGESSVRDLAVRAGMTESRLQAILAGQEFPDLVDVRSLELALNADLWPEPRA